MIRSAVFAILLAAITAPTSASAQVGCLPPEEPFAYEPPADDPELRALIDEQHQADILRTKTCPNGLDGEPTRARTEFRTILGGYLQSPEDAAGIELARPAAPALARQGGERPPPFRALIVRERGHGPGLGRGLRRSIASRRHRQPGRYCLRSLP